jgi:SHS2 domain-containing protein
MFEIFEHTADLGLRVRGATLEELFAEAARGLFSLIVVNRDDVLPVEERQIEVAGEENDLLLFDWLNELLFAFESEGLLFGEFEIKISDGRLSAIARGEPIDPNRHELDHEVKAITYHELKVVQTESGWLAEVIADI